MAIAEPKLVTEEQLAAALAQMETRMVKWMVGSQVGTVVVIVTLLRLL